MPAIHRPDRTASLLAGCFRSDPFSLPEAVRATGLSVDQIRAAHRRGLIVRLRRGEYVVATGATPEPDDEAEHWSGLLAALDCQTEVVVSHHSAAMLHGLPHVGRRPLAALPAALTRPGDHHSAGPGHRIYGGALTAAEVVSIDGIAVTSMARTAVDVARWQGLPDGLAVVDAAAREIIRRELPARAAPEWTELRAAVLDPPIRRQVGRQFREVLAPMRGWKGVGAAREAVRLMDPAAESVLESISRWVIVTSDLPVPRIGWPVRDVDGETRWADFYWEEAGLIGEADGMAKYAETAELVREKLRTEALEMAGFQVVRWGWQEAVTHPYLLLRRLQSAAANPRVPGVSAMDLRRETPGTRGLA